MKAEHDNLSNQRQNPYEFRRDRLDWISKYLELADKLMQTHQPELSRENGNS
jgi:hypothetical protein